MTDADTEVPEWAAIRPPDNDTEITIRPTLPVTRPVTYPTQTETPEPVHEPVAEDEVVQEPVPVVAVEEEPVHEPVHEVRPSLPVQRPKFTPVTRFDADAFDEDTLDELEARLLANTTASATTSPTASTDDVSGDSDDDEAYTVSEAPSTLLGRPTLPVIRPTLATVPDMPAATSKATLLPDVDTGHAFDDEDDAEDDFFDEAEEGSDPPHCPRLTGQRNRSVSRSPTGTCSCCSS